MVKITEVATSEASTRPSHIGAAEWDARVQLAACYRVFDYLGWTELIYNHITLRVPGPERHFLINPFGLLYGEVTASNLLKIDLEGNLVGPSAGRINPAGFVIHGAIHGACPGAHCVMHTHTTAGMAIACKSSGLTPTNFYAAQIIKDVAYHDFEGITVNRGEQPRLLASLGDKRILILRNHGLLVHGETIAQAFVRLWTLQRACEVQQASGGMAGPDIGVGEAVIDLAHKQALQFNPDLGGGQDVFDAMVRVVDTKDAGYRL